MGQALYRTYRSKKLSEIIGQEHITQALSNALTKGLIAHAYLLTGPRGTGKTSVARILAHEINNLPYTDDGSHLDIIEIDAASNRRIDEIRDLRDKVHIAPTSAKYKIYIIDEVHMLTREAFNALLKTLEEPPAHVIFILATTEVHKLPETIISRTQRFTFRPIEQAKVIKHLREIAGKEKIVIDDEALALIAVHGEGSLRDSTSLLDQIRTIDRPVVAADIEAVLGIASVAIISQIVTAVETHDAGQTVQLLGQLHAQGASPVQTAKQLGELLREQFIANESTLPHAAVINLLSKLLDVPASSDPRNYLEIILLDVALSQRPANPSSAVGTSASTTTSTPQPQASSSPKPAEKPTKAAVSAVAPIIATTPAVKVKPISKAPTTPPKQHITDDADTQQQSDISSETFDDAMWPQVLNTIKKKYNTLYSILSAAQPHFEPGIIKLEVGFAFHQKRLNELNNKKLIAETITDVSGQTHQVNCVLGKGKPASNSPALPPGEEAEIIHTISSTNAAAAAITTKPADDVDYYVAQAEKSSIKPLDAVSDIFGGAELLDA